MWIVWRQPHAGRHDGSKKGRFAMWIVLECFPLEGSLPTLSSGGRRPCRASAPVPKRTLDAPRMRRAQRSVQTLAAVTRSTRTPRRWRGPKANSGHGPPCPRRRALRGEGGGT
jgi:hypothetical protein